MQLATVNKSRSTTFLARTLQPYWAFNLETSAFDVGAPSVFIETVQAPVVTESKHELPCTIPEPTTVSQATFVDLEEPQPQIIAQYDLHKEEEQPPPPAIALSPEVQVLEVPTCTATSNCAIGLDSAQPLGVSEASALVSPSEQLVPVLHPTPLLEAKTHSWPSPVLLHVASVSCSSSPLKRKKPDTPPMHSPTRVKRTKITDYFKPTRTNQNT